MRALLLTYHSIAPSPSKVASVLVLIAIFGDNFSIFVYSSVSQTFVLVFSCYFYAFFLVEIA